MTPSRVIRRSPLGQQINRYSFFDYDVHEALHLSAEERRSISAIAEQVRHEYSGAIDRHSQKLICANIELLLDYSTRYYDRQFHIRTNLNQDLVPRFERWIGDDLDSDKPVESAFPSVRDSALALNISSAYLSDLLKKETGKTTQQHIQDSVVERAKNMLLGSDIQVAQVAYALGFEYPQHFSKLFKAKTGQSPLHYRQRH